MRPRSRLLAAPLIAAAALGGCATLVELPRPMGGVSRHLKRLSGRGAPLDDLTWWLAFPVSVTDLALSLAADVALLPFTAPAPAAQAWAEWRRRRLHEPPPLPPPPPDPARLAALERERAERERQRAAREREQGELRAAVAAARALATDDAERRRLAALAERLWPTTGGPVQVLRSEDVFLWLPEGPITTPAVAERLDGLLRLAGSGEPSRSGATPSARIAGAHVAERSGDVVRALAACDAVLDADPLHGPAWTVRGWARLREGDLARAEADLRLGELLCICAENRGRARAGLARVAVARGRARAEGGGR